MEKIMTPVVTRKFTDEEQKFILEELFPVEDVEQEELLEMYQDYLDELKKEEEVWLMSPAQNIEEENLYKRRIREIELLKDQAGWAYNSGKYKKQLPAKTDDKTSVTDVLGPLAAAFGAFYVSKNVFDQSNAVSGIAGLAGGVFVNRVMDMSKKK